jgi:hypothetical protein
LRSAGGGVHLRFAAAQQRNRVDAGFTNHKNCPQSQATNRYDD